MSKLTEAQQAIYDYMIQTGKKAYYYRPYMGRLRENSYWFVGGWKNEKKVTVQVDKLIKLGLLQVVEQNWHSSIAIAVKPEE